MIDEILMSQFLQSFKLHEVGYLIWETERPVMQDARSRFDLSVYSCWEEEDEDPAGFAVTMDRIETDADKARYEAAWNYLIENRDTVEQILRAELLAHHELGWSGFQSDRTEDTDGWEEIRDLVDWDSPAAIDSLYGLYEISIGPEIRDDCAVLTFYFASSWDTEHGVEISLHRDSVE